MKNLFPYSNSNKRYHTLDFFYKQRFNQKVCKISLDAGFSCPNIDGTVGYGGCIYCSKRGSGEFAGNKEDDIKTQFLNVKKIMSRKWPTAKYIGYFQAHTNTYAPVDKLRYLHNEILQQEDVVGISIATRPDAISKECLDYLEELNKKTYLTIELGLQTTNEKTSKLINRCHSLSCFEKMVTELRNRNIEVVVHIINGLPYETEEDMLNTIKYLNNLDIQGVKIHMLSILKNTKLENLYKKEKFPVLTEKEYINIVIHQLELLKPEIVVHRITGDPKIDDLIQPKWLTNKRQIINNIDKEMKRRDTYQGINKKTSRM